MEKKKCTAKSIIAMILQILLGAFFIYNGVTKWMWIDGVIGFFGKIGYPAWLAYTVATLELLGGILVLFPKTAFQGAVMILGVMVGALYTHIFWGDPISAMTMAILSFIVALTILILRKEGCLIYSKLYTKK